MSCRVATFAEEKITSPCDMSATCRHESPVSNYPCRAPTERSVAASPSPARPPYRLPLRQSYDHIITPDPRPREAIRHTYASARDGSLHHTAVNGLAAQLKAEIHAFRVEARSAPPMDHRDVKAFTKAVLDFWRKHGTKMPTWRKAAKIVYFAIPPTSAASERVFSLLKAMFGKDQDASLSDLIQGALMLRYNKREVG